MKLTYLIAPIVALIPTSIAHISMSFPHPRGDPNAAGTGTPDYNLSSPLSSNRMCGGKAAGTATATFRAGEVVPVTFKGSARHGGGICQFALSYDNDQTFYTFLEIEGSCPDCK